MNLSHITKSKIYYISQTKGTTVSSNLNQSPLAPFQQQYHELLGAFSPSQSDHAPTIKLTKKEIKIKSSPRKKLKLNLPNKTNWKFAAREWNKPVSHQKSHHVCDMCCQDQTWSVHGTCRCPSRESEQSNQVRDINQYFKEY